MGENAKEGEKERQKERKRESMHMCVRACTCICETERERGNEQVVSIEKEKKYVIISLVILPITNIINVPFFP